MNCVHLFFPIYILGFLAWWGPASGCVWSLFILDFVITLNLVLSDALTNDGSDRKCV